MNEGYKDEISAGLLLIGIIVGLVIVCIPW